MRLALARILAASPEDSLPFFTIWVALAFAFWAWERSGIGYLRDFGSPKLDLGSALRRAAFSLAMLGPAPFLVTHRLQLGCGRCQLDSKGHGQGISAIGRGQSALLHVLFAL